jgi:hypothetical protein
MTKRQRDKRERLWLLDLAKKVARDLRRATPITDVIVSAPGQLSTRDGNTGGWYVNVGSVRGDRGSGLQIWLDRWPTLSARKLYVCYKGTRINQIRMVASAAAATFGNAIRFTDSAWEFDRERGFAHLKLPLPVGRYGVPIAELYEASGSWAFYGMYLRQAGPFTRPSTRAVRIRVRRFLELTARSVLAQLAAPQDLDYAAIENRQKVAQHLQRERSARLTKLAKTRDGYTCRVCGFSFEAFYGRKGRGLAEAHHMVPLARLRSTVLTDVADLLTVCANCHRMLHRLTGKRSDATSLRRLVRAHRQEHAEQRPH